LKFNTNVAALNANEASKNVNKQLNNSLEKLSSGLKINKASDDASGLAIADKLRTQASSIKQAVDNGNSAVALLQIADKAMAEQSNILDVVKQKLIQAKTATTSVEGREAIRKDITKLLEQINNIAGQTNYNGTYLLQSSREINADPTEPIEFQMGGKSDNIIFGASGIQSNTLGLQLDDLRILEEDGLRRGDFGSTQNQVESAIRNLMTQETNIKSAESVIRDVDYAQESANFSQRNIISQAGTFALSQANQVQQNVLRLLQ
jgi:flagellin